MAPGIGIGHHLFDHAHLVKMGRVDVETHKAPVVVRGQCSAVNDSVLSNFETAHLGEAQVSVRGENASRVLPFTPGVTQLDLHSPSKGRRQGLCVALLFSGGVVDGRER